MAEFTARDKEKLDVLNGERGDKADAAAKMKHLKALVSGINTEPSGDAAADIKAIFSAINAMRAVLQ